MTTSAACKRACVSSMPTVRAHRDRTVAMERAARALTAGVLKFLPSRQANYRVKDLKSRPCPNVHMCCSRFVQVLLCLRARCRETPYLRQCYVSWLGCDFVSSVKRMRVSMHTTPKRQCHASVQIALRLLPDGLDLIKNGTTINLQTALRPLRVAGTFSKMGG